jgi:hypothetical protein
MRAALVVFLASAGTNIGAARVPNHFRAAAPGVVVARLDVRMQAEEVVVVVVSAMSERMKTWGGGGSAQGGLAARDNLGGLNH